MKIDRKLQDLFNELNNKAYNVNYHNYRYKESNQIIRKHMEELLINTNKMKETKEKTKVFNASLTPSEIKRLEEISKEVFGITNKSGMVRYWINGYNKAKTM